MHYILRRVFFCFLSLALVAGTIACGWVQGMRRDISASVLRLHIVANSDSGFDQTVKLQVRDRILTDCGFLFAGSPSAAESAARAREYAGVIRADGTGRAAPAGFFISGFGPGGRLPFFPPRTTAASGFRAGCYTAVNTKSAPPPDATGGASCIPPSA